MQNEFNLLESVGRGKGRYFTLSRSAYELLKGDMQYERRQLTGMDRKQVQRLVKELEPDGVKVAGREAGTKYIYAP